MPGTVQDLTNTLLTSIDSEGNVKDMTVLLTVIDDLEKIEVTAEDLKVTRLGKFINLIRRKLADVDKKLSKRLKKLVKQWLQLVPPSKLPNGVPPTSNRLLSVTPTFGKSSGKKASVERELPASAVPSPGSAHSNSMHVPPSRTRVVSPHPPSSLMRSFSPSLPEHSSQHSKICSSSCDSYDSAVGSSLELDGSQEAPPHSIGNHLPVVRSSTSSTPPASPTPPYSTISSRPSQPISANPTKNRSKVLHMLSGVKKNPSPSKDPSLASTSESYQSTVTEAHHSVLSLNKSSSNSSSISNSFSKLPHQSVLQPSSPLFSPAINIALDASGEMSPAAPWISGNSEFYYSSTFPALSGGMESAPLEEAAMLNGNGDRNHLNILKGSRKRNRSDSPYSKSSSSPKHKKRKRHKQSMGGKKPGHPDELLIRLPLSKVVLRGPSRTVSPSSPEDIVKETRQLVVSFNLSMLQSLPSAVHLTAVHSTAVHPTAQSEMEAWDAQSHTSSTTSVQHSPDNSFHHQQNQQQQQQQQQQLQREQQEQKQQLQREQQEQKQQLQREQQKQQQQLQREQQQQLQQERLQLQQQEQQRLQLQQQEQQQMQQPTAHTKDKLDTPPDMEIKIKTATTTVDQQERTLQYHTPPAASAVEMADNGELARPLSCDIPPDARVGLDGCVGKDGYWYEWTDHICGHGPEVTVLPYIYID